MPRVSVLETSTELQQGTLYNCEKCIQYSVIIEQDTLCPGVVFDLTHPTQESKGHGLKKRLNGLWTQFIFGP